MGDGDAGFTDKPGPPRFASRVGEGVRYPTQASGWGAVDDTRGSDSVMAVACSATEDAQTHAQRASGKVCRARCLTPQHTRWFVAYAARTTFLDARFVPHSRLKRNEADFTLSSAGTWEGELRCPDGDAKGTGETADTIWDDVFVPGRHIDNSKEPSTNWTTLDMVRAAAELGAPAATGANQVAPGAATLSLRVMRVNGRGQCLWIMGTSGSDEARFVTEGNLAHCYGSVWLRNGYLYVPPVALAVGANSHAPDAPNAYCRRRRFVSHTLPAARVAGGADDAADTVDGPYC